MVDVQILIICQNNKIWCPNKMRENNKQRANMNLNEECLLKFLYNPQDINKTLDILKDYLPQMDMKEIVFSELPISNYDY